MQSGDRAQTGTPWRLGHRPALDGLRGIAVLLVVAFHVLGQRFPAGGVVGVTVFFVLSGFLITALLLEERDRSGNVSLWAFYVRRALRLLPALFVMLAVVGALALAADEATPADIGAVALYGANWWQAAGHDLGMLVHTWTLATEEQFYLLWPLALLLLRSQRRLFRVAVTGAALLIVGRIAFAALGGAHAVVYYTNGDALLVGCALAAWLHGRSHAPVSRWATWLLLVGVLGACWLSLPVAVVSAVATALAVGIVYCLGRPSATLMLTWRPLRVLGRRSYGLYLWHLPILKVAWIAGTAAGYGYAVSMGAGLVVLAGVTELSWRYVEQPFLRLKRHSPVAADDPVPSLARAGRRIDAGAATAN